MGQNQRSQGWGGSGLVAGSREGAEVVMIPEAPKPVAETTSRKSDFDGPRPAPSPPRLKQQTPVGFAGSRIGQGVGMATSRPNQVPQWPLTTPLQSNLSQRSQPLADRRPAPQRPPRPSNIPSIFDASELQEHTPAFQYRPQPNSLRETAQFRESNESGTSDSVTSPSVTSPLTPASRPSTTSSVGTIPDFPLPIPGPTTPGTARRSVNIGPPPSARRGASSYYSNVSYVSPIPEESPRSQPSHRSYASSAAMPTGWRDSDSDLNYYDDEDVNLVREDTVLEEGRESRESNLDDGDERDLVRHASLGRRGKPSVITTRSSDHKPSPHGSKILGEAGDAATIGTAMQTATSRPSPKVITGDIIGNADSPLASGTGLIDRTPSSGSVPTLGKNSIPTEDLPAVPSPNPMSLDPRVGKILNGGDSTQSESAPGPDRNFSRLSAVRRPPRLDIDAVRDAEARGSLTSLPDLIRRATKLAAMMDKGKRPGSRLALNDFLSGSDLALEKESGRDGEEKRQSGLSGMLAAFPPPGLATPRDISRDNTPRPPSWLSPYDPSRGGPGRREKQTERGKRRRCCGMPVWVFVLIFVITLIIIAVAVVVPLELLVFKKTTAEATVSSLEQCQQSVSCANGGTNILTDTTCTCICANSFTGMTCTIPDVTGCTTTNTNATTTGTAYHNVTLGLAIPRLVALAPTSFSIPLFADVILARFNAGNLSCGAENALVTFDGYSTRVGSPQSAVTTLPSTNQKMRIRGTYNIGTASTAVLLVSTSFPSIIVDTSSPPPVPSSTFVGVSALPTNSASSPGSATQFVVTQEVLDFARVVVLFVLQQTGLDVAVDVQSNIQSFFTRNLSVGTSSGNIQTNREAMNVSVSDGMTVDFVRFGVDLGQGVVGRPGANASLTASASGASSTGSTLSSASGCAGCR